ncbi:MAG: prephenate dehydrogenase [Clostridiaceae bacterium]|jgi:prephenate dehydrogenase|nr:prephenate dehydrogenase [Clostridiaceae bacterium]
MKNKVVTIVGLGLIGGSIARVIKPFVKKLYAIDNDKGIIKFAIEQCIIDSAPKNPLGESDIVILCIYPNASLDFINDNIDNFKKDAILTDTVGIKTPIMQLYNKLKPHFTYIGAHPMAGKEVSGFINSEKQLFDGANFIITPSDDATDEQISVVEKLAFAMGCDIVIRTTVDEHDRIIAYTSQLPHIIATAMCDTPLLVKHRNFTGGSFEDVTRVAKINENLWSELFLGNKQHISEQIKIFTASLEKIEKAIINDDKKTLIQIMRKVRLDKEMVDNADPKG